MQKPNLIAAWRATYPRIAAFFSAAAFAQRGRDRERRKLVAELEGLDEMKRYAASRQPMLYDRMQALAREDSEAKPPAPNFIQMTSDRHALKPDVGNRRYFVMPEGAPVDADILKAFQRERLEAALKVATLESAVGLAEQARSRRLL